MQKGCNAEQLLFVIAEEAQNITVIRSIVGEELCNSPMQ